MNLKVFLFYIITIPLIIITCIWGANKGIEVECGTMINSCGDIYGGMIGMLIVMAGWVAVLGFGIVWFSCYKKCAKEVKDVA